MPKLADILNCSGCSACESICPKSAIIMRPDSEGFLRPNVNKDICIECGVCTRVCHVVSPYNERVPLKVFAAKAADNEIRYTSSSGGIFPLLAKHIIDSGGIVWGVIWNIEGKIPFAQHSYATKTEELDKFRRSKYVQSFVGNSYKVVKKQLCEGLTVLFSGTPCQIAGLKHYLKKDYPNLICVEIICHGVPSPKVFHDYMREILDSCAVDNPYKISDVIFREKQYNNFGWRNGVVVVVVENEDNTSIKESFVVNDKQADSDPYLKCFLGELINRPSCHHCSTRNLKSGADITLGDFWKIDKYIPEIDDNMGVSIVCVNTHKGQTVYSDVNKSLSENREVNWASAIDSTGALIESPKAHSKRACFFREYPINGFQKTSLKYTKPTYRQLYSRYRRGINRRLKSLLKQWKSLS